MIWITAIQTVGVSFGTYAISKWTVSGTSGGLTALILQFCMLSIPQLIFYYIGIRLSEKFKQSSICALSFLGAIGAYISFFAIIKINNDFSLANAIYGVLYGIFQGLYWSTANNINVVVSTPTDRRVFVGHSNAWGIVCSIVAPATMIAIVLLFGAETRIPEEVYTVFFAVCLLCQIACMFIAASLNIGRTGKPNLRNAFDSKDKRWTQLLFYCFLVGFVGGVPAAIGSVFIIALAQYGTTMYLVVSMLGSILAFVSGYFFSTKTFYKHRDVYFIVAVASEAVSYLVIALIYHTNPPLILPLVCFCVKMVMGNIGVQTSSVLHMNIISEYAYVDKDLSGRYLGREVVTLAGRLLAGLVMLAVALLVNETVSALIGVLLGYFVANALILYLYTKLKNYV